MTMKTVNQEQETTISWNATEKFLHIYSSSPKTQRHLKRLGFPVVMEERHYDETILGLFFAAPLTALSFRAINQLNAPGGLPASATNRSPARVLGAKSTKPRLVKPKGLNAEKQAPEGV